MALPTDSQLKADVLADVYNNRWFATLPAVQQVGLLRSAKTVWLKNHQIVFRKNATVRAWRDGFMLLAKGMLKVSSSTLDGREAVLTYVQPGQWFGELSLLDRHQRTRDVVSVGKSQLLVIEAAEFARLMQDASFSAAVVDLLASRTRLMMDLVEDFSLRTTRSRAARRLIMLAADDDPHQPPVRKDLKISHDALASMIGLTRPALASQLKALTQMGAIAQGYGKIHITSMVTLMAQAAVG